MNEVTTQPRTRLMRLLDSVERIGNRLPHPAFLFALLAVMVVVLSHLVYLLDYSAVHPGTKELIKPISLLTADGLRYMFSSVEKNFVSFPPLGIVLVAMVGIGVADGSGLIAALLRALVLNAPRRLITAAVVAAGILSHLASSASYIVLIPLGALIFLAFRRHPMAGIAAAFAGVSGGFGANFFIGSVDPILAGLSQSAAGIINSSVSISPAVNLYFMMASAVMLVILGTLVTEKIVEPRLGPYDGEAATVEALSSTEKRGLLVSFLVLLVLAGAVLALTVPEGALLRHPQTGSLLKSPFMSGLITGILLIFFIPGLAYGITVGSIRSDKDLIKHITASMKGLAGYIVLVFFAAQFVYYFKYSNMGVLMAIKGAEFLKDIGFTGIFLLVSFTVLSAVINLFMGSASAKWAIMAPIFVPMFMLLGYHPGITQAAFRVGDSITNVITPMMSYFALIVAYAQKYDDRYGMGTIIATMLPYSVVFGVGWILLLILWMALGLPTGPGAPLYMGL